MIWRLLESVSIVILKSSSAELSSNKIGFIVKIFFLNK